MPLSTTNTETAPARVPDEPQAVVKLLEDEFGLSQAQIEERAKVSQATVSRIGAGLIKDPRTSTVRRLKALAHELISAKAA